MHVAITGEKDGYYSDYADRPLRHVGRCLTEGFDYQGQPSPFHEGAIRGEPSRDLPPGAFVSFLQNHDQVGNRAFGERIAKLAIADAVRAATTILLLAPAPPMLFMGEEFSSEALFCFSAILPGTWRRRSPLAGETNSPDLRAFRIHRRASKFPIPTRPALFKIRNSDWKQLEQPESQSWLAFFRELLQIRRCKIVPRLRKFALAEKLISNCWVRAAWRFAGHSPAIPN